MSDAHRDLGPELRQLAQTILDVLDPAVRSAAALAGSREGGVPGPCQQVWCPVCALAALISAEQHPLLTVLAEHSAALLTVVRAMVADLGVPPAGDKPPDGDGSPGGQPPPSAGPGRYEDIPVTVEE